MESKSLNQSIIDIRVKLQNSKLKKTGKNKFAGFDYFELSDFLPRLNELMQEEQVNDRFFIQDGYAVLEVQKDQEINKYTMPFVLFDTPVNMKENKETGEIREVKSMQDIQYLGALNTYYKRYLYLNAFGITDGEVIDGMDNDSLKSTGTKEKKVTEGQLAVLNKLSDEGKAKVYATYGVNALEELSIRQASELISKLKGSK